MRKFQIINPHIIHPIVFPRHLLLSLPPLPPLHQPHQKFKEWSSPGWRILPPPIFLGEGHYVIGLTYIPNLFLHQEYTKVVKFALPGSPYTFRFQLEWGFLNHIEFKFRWKWIDLCVFLCIILVVNMENRNVV